MLKTGMEINSFILYYDSSRIQNCNELKFTMFLHDQIFQFSAFKFENLDKGAKLLKKFQTKK